MTLDRNRKPATEFSRRTQISRVQKFHDGPKLRESVLNWCSGQSNTASSRERANGGGLLGWRILDVLGFIENNPVPFGTFKVFFVTTNQRIGGHHNIAGLDHAIERVTTGALQAMVN